MTLPYVKQTWSDNNPSFPVSAARMGILETGVFDAHYRPGCRVVGGGVSLVTAVATTLSFTVERFDTDTIHDNATNPSRLTCRTPGFYMIWGNVRFATNASGVRQAQIILNGATTIAMSQMPGGGGDVNVVNVVTVYQLAANDYVELAATQTSGGNLNVDANANYSPEFGMSLLSY